MKIKKDTGYVCSVAFMINKDRYQTSGKDCLEHSKKGNIE